MNIGIVLKNSKKDCKANKSFIVCWKVKKIVIKNVQVVKARDIFKKKTMTYYRDLYFKCDALSNLRFTIK